VVLGGVVARGVGGELESLSSFVQARRSRMPRPIVAAASTRSMRLDLTKVSSSIEVPFSVRENGMVAWLAFHGECSCWVEHASGKKLQSRNIVHGDLCIYLRCRSLSPSCFLVFFTFPNFFWQRLETMPCAEIFRRNWKSG